jgi:hypothetical protein
LRRRGAGPRFAVLRDGGDDEISGAASISLAVAPAIPLRPREDLTNAPTIMPSSNAKPALSLGLRLTAVARADRTAFEREAIAAFRFEKPDSNARRTARVPLAPCAWGAAAADSIVKQPAKRI